MKENYVRRKQDPCDLLPPTRLLRARGQECGVPLSPEGGGPGVCGRSLLGLRVVCSVSLWNLDYLVFANPAFFHAPPKMGQGGRPAFLVRLSRRIPHGGLVCLLPYKRHTKVHSLAFEALTWQRLTCSLLFGFVFVTLELLNQA